MRVLVVEDDEDFRQSLVALLCKQGFDVASAEDGPSALKLLDGIDILLTDINLTGMDGLQLCGMARRCRPGLQVIIMTGYDSPWKRAEADRLGARGFLAKPFEKRELLDGLQKLRTAAG